jgi:hypothetical protein
MFLLKRGWQSTIDWQPRYQHDGIVDCDYMTASYIMSSENSLRRIR